MSELEILEEAAAGLAYTKRAMFGGHGLFAPNGAIFAAIVGPERLAVKLPDDAAARAFQEEGGAPWVYEGMDRPMKAWYLFPTDMFDEPRRMAEWLQRAHVAARAAPPRKAARGAKKAKGAKGAARPARKGARR